MTNAVNGTPAPPSSLLLKTLYAPIQQEMRDVEQILCEELRSKHPYVDELVQYGNKLGGKRLRPALLLLTAKALGNLQRQHLVLAAVLEMIHTATLVHDDVLDEADQRRHLATVNARWNNESSVLLGDYLFTHAFYLASTLESTLACQFIGKATNVVCEGELQQIASRANYRLTQDEYFEIINGKTAELTSCCCRLGAHFAGASDEQTERLAGYGRDLGIAFQIADDLLDVLGDETQTGKSLGTDLEKQKPTLPLIHTLAEADDASREQLLELLSAGEDVRAELKPWLQKYGSLEYARKTARQYADKALEAISDLDDSPATDVLRAIPEFVVNRSH